MLTSREIIPKGNLRILCDSEYLNRLMSDGDLPTKIFLGYQNNHYLKFLRTQTDTKHPEIQKIPEITLHYDEQQELKSLMIGKSDNFVRAISLNFTSSKIKQIGTHIFSGKELDEGKTNILCLAIIQAALQDSDYPPILGDKPSDTGILITDKKVLLKNRLWLEKQFRCETLNIVTIHEAKEIVDLFLKYHNQYYLFPHYQLDKGYHYFLSFQSKIPRFKISEQKNDSFAKRFYFLLMSIDEIGFQYYSGATNNSMDNSIYHFNYFITLVTGIFDSLAITTRDQYKIKVERRTSISLNSSSGRDFLKELGKKNNDLRKHIEENNQFIKFIYELRDEIIHRHLLPETSFIYNGDKKHWKMNFIKINEKLRDRIRQCKDKPVKYQVVTNFGYFEFGNQYYLEPFSFTKSSARMLVEFSNKYLELSGFSPSEKAQNILPISELHPLDLPGEIEAFGMFRLGF